LSTRPTNPWTNTRRRLRRVHDIRLLFMFSHPKFNTIRRCRTTHVCRSICLQGGADVGDNVQSTQTLRSQPRRDSRYHRLWRRFRYDSSIFSMSMLIQVTWVSNLPRGWDIRLSVVPHIPPHPLTAVDNQDEALRVAKSLVSEGDLIFDARKTSAADAEKLVNHVTSTHPVNRGHGGCAATIVLPESQHAFDYAAKITRKHGIVMTVSVVLFRL